MVAFRRKVILLLPILLIIKIIYIPKGFKCYNCICNKRGDNDKKDCEACFRSGKDSKEEMDSFKTQVGGDFSKPGADADKAIFGKDCLGKEVKGPTCMCSADLCTCERPRDVESTSREMVRKQDKKCICREDMDPIVSFLMFCDVRFYTKEIFRVSDNVPQWFKRMSRYIPPFHFELDD